MSQVAIAAAGFAIVALLLLFFQQRSETVTAAILGRILISVLIVIECLQLAVILERLIIQGWLSGLFLVLLGSVGPLFYLYSQHIINSERHWSYTELGHFIAVVLVSIVGINTAYYPLAYALMFVIGGVYMALLIRSLYVLRHKRSLFKMEFLLTALFLSWAGLVVALGLFSSVAAAQWLTWQTIMLSVAVAAALHIQLNYPHLLSTLEDIATREYQATTLNNIDTDEIISRLERLMKEEKLYQDASLSLSSCAERLSIKSYQLSELLNTRLGIGFAAYLRRQRVRAAEKILLEEPRVSVLAIGLSVGFNSQSAFYAAFRELHAMAPGQYRRHKHSD